MEHHANLVPWQLLVQEKDGDLEFIPITDDGILRLDVFEVLLRLKPKLVAFTHVSNTLGTINPVREMVEMAHAAGALVLVDGAQAVPARAGRRPGARRRLLRVQRPQDARRRWAPGALWARRELLEAMPPFLAGGEMIREVHLRRSDFNDIPWKFEAGTPAVGDAIGLGVAADYLTALGMDAVREHERDLVAYALETLPARGPRHRALRPAGPRRCAAASSRSTCPASTRTTSPRSSTGSGSRSGPATTARCRSTSGSTSRRRPGPASASTRRRDDIDAPASTSTRPARTSTPSPPASGKSSASSTADQVRPTSGIDAGRLPSDRSRCAIGTIRHRPAQRAAVAGHQEIPRTSSTRPQWKTRTATRTPKAARTRIAAAAIDASRSPPWNSL